MGEKRTIRESVIDEELNQEFELIRSHIDNKFKNKKIFISSSFQTHSIPLLHIIHRINKNIPVFFLNTGYHFPETLSYKETISRLLGLEIIDILPSTPKNHQKDDKGNLFFTSDPDYCCYLNKIQPLEPILIEYDVWISGVRAEQTENRKTLKLIDQGPFNITRYHPMINWTKNQIRKYIDLYDLPAHPLDYQGYSSIGCIPCTRKMSLSTIDERSGRWAGLTKTECGLHTQMVVRD